MQLQSTEVQVERHGDIQETEFGIGDPWLLIEYLTKNVYSDIPRVIIQEIGCNARDAHREIGQTRPIRIILPNRLDQSLKIRDFGPGMDPVRMHTIFKKYGNSSKRGDNKQTGGFGIGGKTPWAYADVFTMRSTAMENGKLVCREYSAIKAEDRTLKLVEMGSPIEIDVNDPNIPADDKHTGLIVSVQIEKDDWDSFANKAIEVTKFWKLEERPEICGREMEYPTITTMYEGKGWKLLNAAHGTTNKYGSNHGSATVLVDGVPYPLVPNSLGIDAYGDSTYSHLRPLTDARFIYEFGVGELTVALSRETLQYDERTKKALLTRIEEAFQSLKIQVDDALKGCTTLREAIGKYTEMQRTFQITSFVKKAMWNGFDVTKDSYYTGGAAKVRQYKKESGAYGIKIRSKEVESFNINDECLLCFLDVEQRSVLRVHTLFAENPDIDVVQVIERGSVVTDEDWDLWTKSVHFKEFAPRNMSTVEKMKRQRGASSNSGTVTKAYRFLNRQENSPRDMWANHDIDMEDGEEIYVTLDRGICNSFPHENLHATMKLLGQPRLIGVPTRFASQIGDGWKPLKEYIAERIAELETTINFQALADSSYCREYSAHKFFRHHAFLEITSGAFLSTIDDQSCPLVRWLKRSMDIASTPAPSNRDYETYCLLMQKLGKTASLPPVNDNIQELLEECRQTYPLFFIVASETDPVWEAGKNDLAFYVNSKNQALTSVAMAV